MKWLLLLLLGASLANAQTQRSGKRCLADFARDERERTELYANTVSPDSIIDRAKNVLGDCPDLNAARTVILVRDDVSWSYTTTTPKKAYNDMIDFLRDQHFNINDSDPLELRYMHTTRDGKRRKLIVKSDMDLWAAFLMQSEHDQVELIVFKNSSAPTKTPTTPFPTKSPTTLAPTHAFSASKIVHDADVTYINEQLSERVNMVLGDELWYRMTKDGKSSGTFRNKVKSKGPHVAIMQSTKSTNGKNHIVGAYIDISWTATNKYFACDKCFIFYLNTREDRTSYKVVPLKSNQVTSTYATYHYTSYGTCLGYSTFDLCINSPSSPYGQSATGGYYTSMHENKSSRYYFDASNTSTFYLNEWEVFPVKSILPMQTALWTKMEDKADMDWIISTLPKDKKYGYRCYRGNGLGRSHSRNTSYFRESCSVKGPLLFIVKTTKGHIFGGYSGIDWSTSTPGYQASMSAYLWVLKGVKGNKVFMPLKNKMNNSALYMHTSYTMGFGNCHDLIMNSPSSMSGYANVGCAYETPNKASSGYYLDGSSSGWTATDWEAHVILDKGDF